MTINTLIGNIEGLVTRALEEDEPRLLVEVLKDVAYAYREFRKGTVVYEHEDTAALFKDLAQNPYFIIGVKREGWIFHSDYLIMTPVNASVEGLVSSLPNGTWLKKRIRGVECRIYYLEGSEVMISPNKELIMKI